MTTLTIRCTADELEQVAFTTGDNILYGKRDAETIVTTEGGVRLRLVAPLGGAR